MADARGACSIPMGVLLLLLATFIWGTAFLAQKVVAGNLGPIAVTVLRNILGGVFLLVCILVRRRQRRSPSAPMVRSVIAGCCCGVPLFFAMLTQQVGIVDTTPGISAFLTANYVLLVPVGAALIRRRLPPAYIWCGVFLALFGTLLICLPPEQWSQLSGLGRGIGRGEAYTLVCAVLFTVQMLVVDHFAAKSDLLVMSMSQLFTCVLLGLPFLLLSSEASCLASFSFRSFSSIWPIIYLGVFSSGIAYTLQNVAQSRTPPSLAAILMSLESVFGALSGWIVLGDTMTTAQFWGCALVFAAAVVTQVVATLRLESGKSA